MRKFLRAVTTLLVFIISVVLCMSLCFSHATTYADEAEDDNCVETSILGNGEVCDDGSGSSVNHVFEIVVEILTIGVGIVGVVGIMVAGIQYLTAGGSEEKTTKAKRRIFEIVLGLAAYAVLWVFANWVANIGPFSTGGFSGSSGSSGTHSGASSGSASKPNNKEVENGWYKIGKKIYHNTKGKKSTGRTKINGSYYYFNKNGVMQTGFVTVKKSGSKYPDYYYYKMTGKDKGKQLFGKRKIQGPYNKTNRKDTWYFNNKIGKLEGVELAVVTQHQQSQCGCGPTSTAMILTYISGKNITECMVECGGESCSCSADLGYCPDDHHWYALETFTANNYGQISPYKTKFGYRLNDANKHTQKEAVINQLFSGKPLVFQSPPYNDNPVATELGFTMGAGHFLVISGYYQGNFIFNDPGGRITSADWSTLQKVDFSDEWFPSSWHFLKKVK